MYPDGVWVWSPVLVVFANACRLTGFPGDKQGAFLICDCQLIADCQLPIGDWLVTKEPIGVPRPTGYPPGGTDSNQSPLANRHSAIVLTECGNVTCHFEASHCAFK